MAYLHGVESEEIPQSVRPVREVPMGIVGLVGTAPIHLLDPEHRTIHEPVQVLHGRDMAKKLGPERPGFTIPRAQRTIFGEGGGRTFVVNVFDPATHKQSVSDESLTLSSDGTATTANPDIISLTLTSDDGGTSYTRDADFTLDQATGTITRLADGQIPEGASLTASYEYADPSLVSPADIIGGVTDGGDRTGMQAWLDCFNLFGTFPKICIAPVYATQASVVSALRQVIAEKKCKAVAYADAPIGTTRDDAIKGRGPEGDINFNVADERIGLLYPHLEGYNRVTERTELFPYSAAMAGIRARTDREKGVHVSASNEDIRTATGVERRLSARVNDPDSDVNKLNEAGIITVFNNFGSGLLTWGNRSSAWPSSTAQDQFIQTRRTFDELTDSIEYWALQYIDGPVTQSRIEGVIQSVQAYLNAKIDEGALLPGAKIEFLPERNPPEQLAAGHVVWTLTRVATPPMERMTFEHITELDHLTNLYK